MNSWLLTNIHCEGHAHRVLNTLELYFILRIEVGDSQRHGTTPLEEFDAHQELSLFFWLVFGLPYLIRNISQVQTWRIAASVPSEESVS